MDGVIIRTERPGDEAVIHQLHASTFPSDGEARLVDLLRSGNRLVVSLVAEIAGVLVGHVGFSPVTAASVISGAGLAPVSVSSAHRRKGIAARLIENGLDDCKAAGIGWVVVLGEPGYYSRFGFRPASEFGLSDEYGGGGAFQAIELVSAALPVGAGLVRYAPEFAEVA